MIFIGLLRTLEQITRPPRLGHDVDVEDGAEQLAEREAETECLVPEDFNAVCRCVACVAEERAAEDELAADDDEESVDFECMACGAMYSKAGEHDCPTYRTPNPTEPPLTPDELVGVRGLLQERYEPDDSGAVKAGLSLRNIPPCDHRSCRREGYGICLGVTGAQIDFIEHTKSSASNHTGTGAEPAPSPTIVQSAPPPTVDGEGPSACEHSPAPAEGRPTSELLTEAARIIGNLSQYTVEYFYRDLMHELCERAATFKAIEE